MQIIDYRDAMPLLTEPREYNRIINTALTAIIRFCSVLKTLMHRNYSSCQPHIC